MIGLVVLGTQRFETELVGGERGRRIETNRHELIRGHDRDGWAGQTPALGFFSAGNLNRNRR